MEGLFWLWKLTYIEEFEAWSVFGVSRFVGWGRCRNGMTMRSDVPVERRFVPTIWGRRQGSLGPP